MDNNAIPDRDERMPGKPRLGKQLGLRSGDALLVIDVQRDFLPGGHLAVAAGDRVIPALNACMAAFAARQLPVFLTRDWHPENHCSFASRGGPWPAHCVQGTPGAEWAKSLVVPEEARIVSKATQPDIEAYSAFAGTSLLVLLRGLGVNRLFVGGLATEFCVHDTVMDAGAHGFEVVVLVDAIRAVDTADAGERALQEMVNAGAVLSAVGRRTA